MMVQVTRTKILGFCFLSGVATFLLNTNLPSAWSGASPVFLARKQRGNAFDLASGLKSPCGTELMGPLRSRVDGLILCPRDKGFGETISIFNTKHKKKHIPALAFQPYSTRGVADALLLAKDFGMIVTVKCGGHNPAGLSREEGGLLIDMGRMKEVKVDVDSMTMISEGGALWSDAQSIIKDKNVTFVGGGCPSVGVVGLVLGGGVGWTSRKRGLASDNVLSMEVVLENGTVAIASDTTNPELFWGLRGAGGSNFGVVTKVAIKLYPAEPEYFAGMVGLKTDNPDVWEKVLSGWLDGAQDLKDNGASPWLVFSSQWKRGTFSTGTEYLTKFDVPLFYDGPSTQGSNAFAPILHRLADVGYEHPDILCKQKGVDVCKNTLTERNASELISDWLRTGKPYLQKHSFVSWSQSMGGEHVFLDWKSGVMDQIDPFLVTTAIEAMKDAPAVSSFSGQADLILQFQIEYLGGEISVPTPNHSSFGHRSARLLLSIQGFILSKSDPPKSLVEAGEKWSNSTFTKLQPFFKGSYSNYADLGLGHQDWQHKYYREQYERLQKLKKDVGGFDLFRGRQRIEKL